MPLIALPPTAPEIPGVRLTQAPNIDGKVMEAEWGSVPVVSGRGFESETGATGPETSEYRIGYDDKFIYFAAKLSDSQPNRIRSTAFRQNVSLSGDDRVGLYVDPFGTLSDGNNFEINPLGATNIRVNGGRAAKLEWLGAMEAKARRTDSGWEAEARIPWSVMRLPTAGQQNLRINFYRSVSRLNRTYYHEDISNGRRPNTPVWQAVQIPALPNERVLKLLPYGYGGYEDPGGHVANAGLDFKYNLTDSLDMIGSVNPDFRNIENQVLSVDFSYFERLAGETRPFFLEGGEYFRTSGDSPIFASQRIGGFDVGGKAYGKIGTRTQVAALHTRDFGVQDDLVGSVRQNFGPRTNMVVAGTRLARPGLENAASHFGFSHGIQEFDLFFQHQTTRDTVAGQGRRVNTGFFMSKGPWTALGEWVEVTPQFLPRLGFAPRRDYRGYNGFASYTKIVPKGKLQEYEVGLDLRDWRTFRGENFSRGGSVFSSATLREGTDIDFGFSLDKFRNNDDRLMFIDVERPVGDPYRTSGVNFQSGKVAGHDYQSVGLSMNMRPTPRLQISGNYQSVRHFDASDQTVFSVSYDMNMADSISGRFFQQDRRTSWYLAFRRAGNRGAEYYVILGEPQVDLSRSFQASLVLKAVFPVDWKL